jgi:hypothetical protein
VLTAGLLLLARPRCWLFGGLSGTWAGEHHSGIRRAGGHSLPGYGENKGAWFAAIKLASIVLNVALNLFFIVLPSGDARQWLPGLRRCAGCDHLRWAWAMCSPFNLVASGLTLLLLCGAVLLDFQFRLNLEPLRPLLKYAYRSCHGAGHGERTWTAFCCAPLAALGLLSRQSSLLAVGIYGGRATSSVFFRRWLIENGARQTFFFA